MRITWANYSKRWFLVSNVSVTCNNFREFNTSDWFPYVWALQQNRWRLRRLHILKYATQLSCILQYCHCTFVTILFRLLARLSVNLAACVRALITKSASFLWLVEQAFRRMPFFTEWSCASSFEESLHGSRAIFPLGLLPLGLLVLDAFFALCCVEDLGEGFGCVEFARLFISCRKLQLSPFEHCPLAFDFFVHSVWFPDSGPRRLFQNFHFWLQTYSFSNSARYFFLPLSSICDNQVQPSSDESPYFTIPIRSRVSQTLVFLICTKFPRCHQMGLRHRQQIFIPFWIEFLNIIISRNNCK